MKRVSGKRKVLFWVLLAVALFLGVGILIKSDNDDRDIMLVESEDLTQSEPDETFDVEDVLPEQAAEEEKEKADALQEAADNASQEMMEEEKASG